MVRHEEREHPATLTTFAITSNRHDKKVEQPPGWCKKYPLRPEQLRSLGWMTAQESTTSPFVAGPYLGPLPRFRPTST